MPRLSPAYDAFPRRVPFLAIDRPKEEVTYGRVVDALFGPYTYSTDHYHASKYDSFLPIESLISGMNRPTTQL